MRSYGIPATTRIILCDDDDHRFCTPENCSATREFEDFDIFAGEPDDYLD